MAEVKPVKYEIEKKVKHVYTVGIFIGLIIFVVGLSVDKERIWHSYLTSFFYFTSLALGGLFFTAIQHLVKAGWSVTIRRITEGMTTFIPYAVIGAVVLLLGVNDLFPWTDTAKMESNAMLAQKMPYLNVPFFVIRLGVFFLAWWFFAKKIIGNSLNRMSPVT